MEDHSRPRPSPFKVGDRVVYAPSDRGYNLDANDPPENRLTRGAVYTVAELQKGSYIVVAGWTHPLGGIYWTEFVPAPADAEGEPREASA